MVCTPSLLIRLLTGGDRLTRSLQICDSNMGVVRGSWHDRSSWSTFAKRDAYKERELGLEHAVSSGGSIYYSEKRISPLDAQRIKATYPRPVNSIRCSANNGTRAGASMVSTVTSQSAPNVS